MQISSSPELDLPSLSRFTKLRSLAFTWNEPEQPLGSQVFKNAASLSTVNILTHNVDYMDDGVLTALLEDRRNFAGLRCLRLCDADSEEPLDSPNHPLVKYAPLTAVCARRGIKLEWSLTSVRRNSIVQL